MTADAPDWRDPLDFYATHADAFDASRNRAVVERGWLEALRALMPPGGRVLDLGCGMGEPVAAWLLAQGFALTGVDGTRALLDRARARLPAGEWIEADLRGLDLGRRFDGIVAWDGLFLLAPAAQRALFATFAVHAQPGAPLLFNSGTERGEGATPNYGEPLYHASLSTQDYRDLLDTHGFEVVRHVVSDMTCGERTIWLARRKD